MKSTYSRRYRRSPSQSREGRMFKKDNLQEQTFFGTPVHENFFKPNVAIQRKCAHCEAEDKKAHRMTSEKKEEEKIHKMSDKKEEEKVQRQTEKKEEKEVHRQAEHKEEEKKIQKTDEKKEEDKTVHRQGEKKEEEKVQRQTEKKEEKELHRQPEHKEEEKKIQKMDEKKEEDKTVHRQGEKKEEEKNISKKESGGSGSGIAATGTYIQSLTGKGQALPKEVQYFFAKKMGYDFSSVKIHTGTEAEKSAKDINAKAYTTGNNIVFNKGQYNPGSSEGKKLLAHELTHVVQQRENNSDILSRVTEKAEHEKEEESSFIVAGQATNTKNKTAYGNCEGVTVQGQTDANYTDSFNASVNARSSTTCEECAPPDCISATGIIVSRFRANPVITLPSVPDGLSECESRAVGRFINTTLTRHEQQHVRAFNTYNGVVRTPYRFTGCRAELDMHLQSIHDGINAQRQASANALSSALDPFNTTIPCNCEE